MQEWGVKKNWGGPIGRYWLRASVLTLVIFLCCACKPSSSQTASGQSQQRPDTFVSHSESLVTRPHVGFATEQKLTLHYNKHRREFGSIGMGEYLRRAQELRDRPAGGEVLEVTRPDGVTSRFDRASGSFMAFNRDGVIRTFFRPNEGEAYFWRQVNRRH